MCASIGVCVCAKRGERPFFIFREHAMSEPEPGKQGRDHSVTSSPEN